MSRDQTSTSSYRAIRSAAPRLAPCSSRLIGKDLEGRERSDDGANQIQEFLQLGQRRIGDVQHVLVVNRERLRYQERPRIVEIGPVNYRHFAVGSNFNRLPRPLFQSFARLKAE